MKRVLIWLGVGVAGLVLLIILFVSSGYLLPAETTFDFEQFVDAPPEALFVLFSTYDGVDQWWRQAANDMDDDFEVTHLGGPTQGVGMELGFGVTGQQVFERWTYTSVEPPIRVEMDVDFQIFMSRRALQLAPEGSGTMVRWRETAHVDGPVWRWIVKLNTESAIENRHTVLSSAGTAARH